MDYRRRGSVLSACIILFISLLLVTGCDEKESRRQASKYAQAATAAFTEQRYADAFDLYKKSLEQNKLNFSANLGMAKLLDCWKQDNAQAVAYYQRCLDLPDGQKEAQSIQNRIAILQHIMRGSLEDPAVAGIGIAACAIFNDEKHLLLRLTPQGCGRITEAGGMRKAFGDLQGLHPDMCLVLWRDFSDADTALVVVSEKGGAGTAALSLVLKKSPEQVWLLDNFSISK